ncbi:MULTISPECIES: NAD/NADP transhydrogenase subunit alpha [unclassified Rhizobium]|uniref:NAD/NADP transhydrogenase subunit alpha n=1 Tax=unclassified Rhizobium TaxID=2613769 RepID=UPI0016220DC6|nr:MULTISPECIES: NAD/NADP transhydrogenase subunit alpha [unclassified Rhizobium]MBB3541243.1 NAD(P) transhydrogenase subunit alpha [Rhizobium sp. BK399]MCS3739968.1 NAD(P) transhydrogenase subunit alpha [Rhizobium sp. BK661]MCS4092082.1 NAD(P) transhydrogenase subunit alpha [Rhizobium sp. BK176]
MSKLIRVRAGLLRETHPGERRVALTPDDVGRLSERISFRFEPGCGVGAGHSDDGYIAAGAEPADFAEMASSSDLFVSVRQPIAARVFPAAAVLLFLGSKPGQVAVPLARQQPLHLDIARLSGMSGQKGADISSRQAAITGHAAVLEAARQFGISHPMLLADGSFVRPVKMAALGSDPASLQALATARRLGALTYGFGLAKDSQAKIERLGAKFLGTSSEQELARLRQDLSGALSKMQLITTNIMYPGRSAPVLLNEEMLSQLSPGTVIVDLAAEIGGNCALTRADETTDIFGIRIIGSTTLASQEAAEASRHFSDGLSNLLEHLIDAHGALRLDGGDSVTAALLDERSPARHASL